MNLAIRMFLVLPSLMLALNACSDSGRSLNTKKMEKMDENKSEEVISGKVSLDTATFGAGCFWCVEAVFQDMKGVLSVSSGYSGGKRENPSYEQVCSGATGHAEVVQLVYDPSVVPFKDLLEVFWSVHDPTTLNRQGADVGTQYRSVVFYHSEEQKNIAEEYKRKLDDSNAFSDPIVTEIVPFVRFYKAENYHQNYYNENGDQPYCSMVIRPKVEKFRKVFGDKLK